MSSSIKLSIIPHTHWDREWYFSSTKSLVASLQDFDEVIDVLKANDQITCFLIDAQSSIVEDYLVHHEDKKADLINLIKANRILVGPWYAQSDLVIAGGESILRNLMYGIKSAEGWGRSFMVGYAIDCFGQSAQMPQIYNGVGINKTIFKRGLRQQDIPFAEFIWNGPAKSSVFAYHAVDYMNFMNPSPDPLTNKTTLEKLIQKDSPRSKSKNIIVFNGFDQFPIRQDIDVIVEDLKPLMDAQLVIESIETSMDNMIELNLDYPHYTGELTCGETGRVHKSIYSSRADLKTKYAKLENKLVNEIEPLSVFEMIHNGRHESSWIKTMWKLMMENAAHDSLGSCNSDEVNREIDQRLDKVAKMSVGLESMIQRRVANMVLQNDQFQFQIYNYLPLPRTEVISLTLLSPFKEFCLTDTQGNEYDCIQVNSKEVTKSIQGTFRFKCGLDGDHDQSLLDYEQLYEVEVQTQISIDPMGYETISLKENKVTCISATMGNSIENEHYQIGIQSNGSLDIVDRHTKTMYPSMLIFEDGGDDGDSYDYSTPVHEWVLDSNDLTIQNLKISSSAVQMSASYQLDFKLPSDSTVRANHLLDKVLRLDVTVTLNKDDKRIYFNITLNNTATEHRLRVCFKTPLSSSVSYADQQFGTISRPTYLKEVETWIENKWTEKPRTIEPMQSFVTLKNKSTGIAVMTDCVREYQIVGGKLDTIALTLYRSFPMMGKSDLLDRPGRCSGMPWPTEDANLYKTMDFNFALVLGSECTSLAFITQLAKAYTTPLRYHQELSRKTSMNEFVFSKNTQDQAPERFSLFELTSLNVGFSILKKQEEGNYPVVRFFGVEDGPLNWISHAELQTQEVSHDERRPATLKRSGIEENEIVTLVIKGGLKHE